MLSSLALLLSLAQPAQSAPVTWVVAERAEVVIGASAVDARQQFVRVAAAETLDDGTIVVLDAAIPAVRLYDARGRWVRDLGRVGDGPGEFREPMALARGVGRIGILERAGEIEWLLVSGRSDGRARVPLGAVRDGRYNLATAALLPDGSALLRANERMFGRARGEYRQEVGLLRVRADGVTDTLGWFAGDSGRADARAPHVPRPYVPGTGLLVAVAPDRIAVMTADRAQVRILDGRGRRLAEWAPPLGRATRASDDDVSRAIDDQMRGVFGNDERVVREWAEGRPRLALGPLATRLLFARGSSSELWIERLGRPEGRARWLVVSETGAPIAEVTMPVGVDLLEVGAGHVLGIHRDEDGVETVVRHALRRN